MSNEWLVAAISVDPVLPSVLYGNSRKYDHKYFLPLSVSYSIIADGRRSYRSCRPRTFLFSMRCSLRIIHVEVTYACGSIVRVCQR